MVRSASKFGGCNGKIENCLPIAVGWNYTARVCLGSALLVPWRSYEQKATAWTCWREPARELAKLENRCIRTAARVRTLLSRHSYRLSDRVGLVFSSAGNLPETKLRQAQ